MANQQQSIASHKDPQIPQSKPTIPPIPTIRTNQQPSSSLEQRSISFLRPPICHKPPTSNFDNPETAPHLPWVSSSPWPQVPQSKPTNGAYSPIQTKPTFIFFSSTTHNSQTLILLKLPKNPRSKNSHHRPNFRVLASANLNGSDGFSWLSLTRSCMVALLL